LLCFSFFHSNAQEKKNSFSLNNIPVSSDFLDLSPFVSQPVNLEAQPDDESTFLKWQLLTSNTVFDKQSSWYYSDNGLDLGNKWFVPVGESPRP
jgi:hypothetical protein